MAEPFAKLKQPETSPAQLRRRVFRQHREDVIALFRTVWGRRLAWQWFEDAGVPTGQPFAAHPEQTSFNCGKQDLAQQLWAEAWEHCPELLMQMREENRGGDS